MQSDERHCRFFDFVEKATKQIHNKVINDKSGRMIILQAESGPCVSAAEENETSLKSDLHKD